MKIKFTGLILALLFSSTLFGGNVDLKEASRVARNFYYERVNSNNIISYDDINISSVFTEQEDGSTIYYAFNISKGGFVIVSAEDVLIPVIGYSFEGNFSNENYPVQFSEWMNNVKEQTLYHRQRQTESNTQIKAEWDRLSSEDVLQLKPIKGSKSVDPLLLTTWNQGAHYNELCPADPDGPAGKVYAGCVATAMAQVMFYYRFPETGLGNHAYNSDYGYLSVNFGATTYEWDEMLPSISTSNLAVATLLYHCGVAVDMMYSPNGSGAYSDDAANAMINNFRYSPATHLEYKDNYSDDDWADLLRNQLDDKKPMYYHGFGSGGHAFNVDGYQPGDYFHFNWGWSGSYNGYFYLNNLNPGGSNFTYGQGAIIDIYPTGNYPLYCTGTKTYTGQAGTVDDGSGPLYYQGGADCYYLLNPQANPADSISKLKLTFNFLDTENNNDLVTIFNGPTTNDPVLGSFSGSTLPSVMFSASNKVLVHFTSDATINGGGFLLSYESIYPEYCDNIAIYRAQTGVVEDGSGPKNYNNKTVCQYLIQPQLTGRVNLNFTQFHTENIYDFVEVYAFDTLTQQGSLLGRFSGNQLPPALFSNTGAMFLIFFANPSINNEGWQATYYVTPVGLEDNKNQQEISLYPNPATHSFNLSYKNSAASTMNLEIVNITGQLVFKQQLESNNGSINTTISTENLSKGNYTVRLISESGVVYKKLIIQ
ncbi:MAG: C10 family peptidase [Bacteroidales bacterium]